MRIGGLQKISLIDFPGRISAILFTQGCNFRCPYCHNPELVDPDRYGPILTEEEVFSFLKKRRGKLEAVTLTGGEPTLQPDLERILRKIKEMGYLTKVDTNGSNPTMLERLIRGRWVDYLAMDVKGPLQKYRQIVKADVEIDKIRKSIKLMASSKIGHEFRTTVVRSLLNKEDLITTAKLLKRGLYVLQPHLRVKCLDSAFLTESSYTEEEFSEIRLSMKQEQLNVVIR